MRSEDTATEDQKDDVYSAAIFGFILVVLMELPLDCTSVERCQYGLFEASLSTVGSRLFLYCCCSREAFNGCFTDVKHFGSLKYWHSYVYVAVWILF